MNVRFHCLFALVACATATHPRAQCPGPVANFHEPGSDRYVGALAVFDDGSGPALFVGGTFEFIGGVHAVGIARWNGSAWSDVGGADIVAAPADAYPYGEVSDMVVFDDGGGPALFVTGRFEKISATTMSGIAKWDGSAWTALGSGLARTDSFSGEGYALAVFQASGDAAPTLHVAGSFDLAGGASTSGFAKWDGAQWIAVAVAPQTIFDLVVHDDGSGPALYAGGNFLDVGATTVNHVAKWDGTTWSALSTGTSDNVLGLGTFDADGPGSAPARLFAGGLFESAGGATVRGIAQWDGSAWSSVGGGAFGFYHQATDFHVADLGDGPALYVGGDFENMGAAVANNIAKWNGSTWSALGSGITRVSSGLSGGPLALFDDGSGPRLFTGGDFRAAGGTYAADIAAWNGSAWSSVGGGDGLDGIGVCARFSSVGSISGDRLFVGGDFTHAGDTSASHVAAWDGSTWSALGSGLTPSPSLPPDRGVSDLLEHDDGSGRALYAVGTLVAAGGSPASYIARWSGSAWSSVGGGLPAPAYALAAYDDGTDGGVALFTAGNLHQLWKWNGAGWTIPEGIGGGDVNAMIVHDDGSGHGKELYIAGAITAIGPVAVSNIAKWRGTACGPCGSALGSGTNGVVLALAVFDENATGTKRLFAAGDFTTAGGAAAKNVARWDGASWSALGSGPGGIVGSLAVFDDGTGHGPQLFAAGLLEGTFTYFLKKWENDAWVSASASFVANTRALAVGRIADGAPSLFLTGSIGSVDGVPSHNIAQIERCPVEPGVAFCFGDGSLGVPCPCAPPNTVPNPSGGADGGCANSFHLDGGKLFATGTTNPDSVVLYGARATPVGLSIFIAGNGQIVNGIAGGDGVRCAGGSFVRFGSQFAAAGNVVYPNPPLGHTLPLHAITATTLGSGTTIYYQLFYRNAALAFCNASTFNFTSAYGVTWN